MVIPRAEGRIMGWWSSSSDQVSLSLSTTMEARNCPVGLLSLTVGGACAWVRVRTAHKTAAVVNRKEWGIAGYFCLWIASWDSTEILLKEVVSRSSLLLSRLSMTSVAFCAC